MFDCFLLLLRVRVKNFHMLAVDFLITMLTNEMEADFLDWKFYKEYIEKSEI